MTLWAQPADAAAAPWLPDPQSADPFTVLRDHAVERPKAATVVSRPAWRQPEPSWQPCLTPLLRGALLWGWRLLCCRVFVRPVVPDDGLDGADRENRALLAPDGDSDWTEFHGWHPGVWTSPLYATARSSWRAACECLAGRQRPQRPWQWRQRSSKRSADPPFGTVCVSEQTMFGCCRYSVCLSARPHVRSRGSGASGMVGIQRVIEASRPRRGVCNPAQ